MQDPCRIHDSYRPIPTSSAYCQCISTKVEQLEQRDITTHVTSQPRDCLSYEEANEDVVRFFPCRLRRPSFASMPQKVADAANIAPYLTHVVSHHGQLSLIPPDNAGRMRQQKQKKPRSINPDDDIRFNTGPKFYKVLPASSRGSTDGQSQSHSNRRRGRPGTRDGRENNSVDDMIPNYPPPSFDEAMSSPPISVCPSTVTLTSSSTRMYHPPSTSAVSAPTSDPASSAITDDYSSDPDSDSDVSLIGSSGSPFTTAFPGEDSRSPTPSPILVGREGDDNDFPTAVTPVSNNKRVGRRKLSLSPLRTLLPLKSSNSPQRALSAHPYSQTRNPSSFFRSTTSLTSLPFGRSATSPSASDKGKEKDTDREDLDSWEFVGRPTSLLLNVELAMSAPLPAPVAVSSRGTQKTQKLRALKEPSPPVTPAPVLVPLVDKKTPFLKSKPKREPRRRDTTPSPLSSLPNTSTEGPVLTTVRTRQIQSVPSQKPPKPASPLRSGETWNGCDSESESVQQAILQRAINTPLPNTPTEKAVVDTRTRDQDVDIPPIPPLPATVVNGPSAYTYGGGGITRTQVQEVQGFNHHQQELEVSRSFSGRRNPNHVQVHANPSRRPVPCAIDTDTQARPSPSSPILSVSSGHTITPTYTPTPTPTPTPTQTQFQFQFSHHYPGRPLPRPPPSSVRAMMVDSTYAGAGSEVTGAGGSLLGTGAPCPEGLLIDFGEPVEECEDEYEYDESSVSRTLSPVQRDIGGFGGGSGSFPRGPGINRGFPPNDVRYRNRTESSVRAATVTEPNPGHGGGYGYFTDLNLLVSRLDETEVRSGESYENLLRLSEFIGPANQTTSEPSPSPLLGWVSVDRRRVTKDGRVRVKLMLLDCGVDKCGICFTQFKEGDPGAMSSSVCRHAYHEGCLKRWLDSGSGTCPNCRTPIGAVKSC